MNEGFRSRTGRERRAKTGARLLEAVFQVMDERGVDGLSPDLQHCFCQSLTT